MHAEEIRNRLDRETFAVLVQRIVTGTALWGGGVFVIAVAEAFAAQPPSSSVQLVRAVGLAALLGQSLAARRVRTRRAAILVANAGVAIIALLTAIVGALRGVTEPRLFLFVSLMLGTAALLPWGPRAQVLGSSLASAAYIFSLALAAGASALTAPMLLQLAIIAGASIFIAYELEHQRISAIKDRLELERGEQVLQQEAAASNILAQAGQQLIASLGTADLLNKLTQFTATALNAPTSHTFLLQPDDDVFVAVAGYGSTVDEWESLRVLRIPRVLVHDLLEKLDREGLLEVDLSQSAVIPSQLTAPYGIKAAVIVALCRGSSLIGVLTAGYREPRKLTALQQRVVRGIGHMASLSLENVRLLEELQAANRLKSEFVATMSHELRTPLNIILGYGSLLRDGEFGALNDEQGHILRLLDQNARQLLDLINATLDLSRLEAGRVPIDIQDVDVGAVVDEVATELQPLADEKPGIHFSAEIPTDLGEVLTDRGKLKLILKNLVGNAFKYTDEGIIEVRVKGAPSSIEFQVCDTGQGISKELLPHIFEAFRQGSSGLSRTHGGVGLGLYIVKRLLELLGGSISVNSDVGEGSVFEFRVPRNPRARAAQLGVRLESPIDSVPEPVYVAGREAD